MKKTAIPEDVPDKITVPEGLFSDRETYSQEINQRFGEGGALNANYRSVEAAMMVSNLFRGAGLVYGKDFFLITIHCGEIYIGFKDEQAKRIAEIYIH